MYKRISNTHAVVVGLLFAMIGFTYALATNTPVTDAVPDVAGRSLAAAAGSNLIFTNPQDLATNLPTLSTDYDLGKALIGSSVVRWARATGGVRPYTFTGSNMPTGLSMLATGELSGSLGATLGALRFQVTVKDSLGTQPDSATGTFNLQALSNVNAVFQFAVQNLSGATELQPYFDVMPVLGGNAPYTYTATGVKVNGTATKSGILADVGLALGTADGVIFGKPLITSGTVTFTATCTDVKGHVAAGYNGTGASQVISIIVSPNKLLASDAVATGITIKAGVPDKDSIQYSGLVNLHGTVVSGLSNVPVVLKIGGYTSMTSSVAGVLNAGKITTGTAGVVLDRAAAPKTPAMTGTLNSNGQLKISIKNETIGTLLTGAALTAGTQGLAVFVQVGTLVSSSAFLNFTVKVSSKGASTLTYKISAANDIGGDLMLTSVQGKDTKGAASDSWKAGFIAVPAGGSATYGSPTSAVIGIGTNSSNSITGVVETNGVVKYKGAKGAAISSLNMTAKSGKGSLQTGALLSSATNILTAETASTAASNTFALGITLSTSSGVVGGGNDGITIFPNKTQWTSKNPTR